MATTIDILDDAASKLEPRFSEIRDQMAKLEQETQDKVRDLQSSKAAKLRPLMDEERETAEAIRRLTGSYPRGYRSGGTRRSGGRSTMGADERKSKVLSLIKSAGSDGTNARAIADEVGASPATVTKDLEQLQGEGSIKREGERRATRYLVA